MFDIHFNNATQRKATNTTAMAPLLGSDDSIVESIQSSLNLNSNSQPTSTSNPIPTCNVVTPVGMLGYGFFEDYTRASLIQKLHNGAPTAIILDSGSTDSGPEKLALGHMSAPRENYARDLKKLIALSWRFRVPLIFSSAGGDGSDENVRELTKIVEEIATAKGNEYVFFFFSLIGFGGCWCCVEVKSMLIKMFR